MSNLIPVFQGNINQDQTQLVDAKLLHSFLEVETRFNDWINRRISVYEFTENIDFITITQKRVIGHGRGKKDYHITLDMAKELSMIERTERGRQARKYFIECEKQLYSRTATPLNETYQITLTDYELYILACLVKEAHIMREKIELIQPALDILGSQYSPNFFSISVDYKHNIEEAKQILARETRHIKTNHFTGRWNTVLNTIRN